MQWQSASTCNRIRLSYCSDCSLAWHSPWGSLPQSPTGALEAEVLTTDPHPNIFWLGQLTTICPALTKRTTTTKGYPLMSGVASQRPSTGLTPSISLPTFSQAVDAAAFGSVDLIASCHKITPERLELVEFSVPYTRDSLGMLSRTTIHAIQIGTQLLEDTIIKTSLITLLVISGLSALGVAVLEKTLMG